MMRFACAISVLVALSSACSDPPGDAGKAETGGAGGQKDGAAGKNDGGAGKNDGAAGITDSSTWPDVTVCETTCAGRACGLDSCGNSCGTCASDQACDNAGQCKPRCPCWGGECLDCYCGQAIKDYALGNDCAVDGYLGHEGDLFDCKADAFTAHTHCESGKCNVMPTGTPDECQPLPGTAPFELPFPCGSQITAWVNLQLSCNGKSWHSASDHYAMDLTGMPRYTPILAARAGTVMYAKNDIKPGNPCYEGPAGNCKDCNQANYVVIRHDDNTRTLYLHLENTSVSVGQSVTQGQEIGKQGLTGCSGGDHLHFALSPADDTGWYPDSTLPIPLAETGGKHPDVCAHMVSQNCP